MTDPVDRPLTATSLVLIDDIDRPEPVRRVVAELAAQCHGHPVHWLNVPARTAQEAADALGVSLGQIAKSVIFRRRADDVAVLVVTAGDRRVDEARVVEHAGPIGRADAAYIKAQTGFSIGGVSPVGHLNKPLVLVDASLSRFPVIWAAAGHPCAVFPLSPAELVRLCGGAPVIDVVQAPVDAA
ncbi:YbaK/EbsC family protein [Sphaerotilus mobilis]|uniref:Prolyl-tRNA editing enzyme YbaK/EbsC (Cys-tRNA(Pro) deacylase) n=1 Tax=Sphaerotilus mobilis TaxID=47994 RepID=A0A4Q7LIV0_9BURK|nr:YbaK/EbsC family protein [Sphaerotilus mobilis]RZS54416.1 prolyl-tRNA editing enzyme YbaK/EbsC (Cys-tRNA(Pro) deacylase) [Sphaerotilus mobilis]